MATRISRSDIRRYSSASTVLGLLALGMGLVGMLRSVRQPGPDQELQVSRAFVPEFRFVEVPVPERPVPAGTVLREVAFRTEKYPEHQVPGGVIRDREALRDLVALVTLPAGLPIVGDNVGSREDATNPILGHIPPGMRAMTVRVDATTAVEGWVRSGSVVDVLLVEKTKTSVVAEKVKVISAERSLSPLEPTSTTAIPSTVTLLVTQEQCLAINTAVPLGKIAFALRSNRDSESWRSTRFSSDSFASSRGSKDTARVEGVVAVGHGASEQRFALVDGAWLPAESVPGGFLLKNRPRREE